MPRLVLGRAGPDRRRGGRWRAEGGCRGRDGVFAGEAAEGPLGVVEASPEVAVRSVPMHPRQRALEPQIEELWLAALGHAQIDPDDAILFTPPGVAAKVERVGAMTWPRPWRIDPGGSPELDALLVEMNDPACIRSIRVAVWTEHSTEAVAGLMRHELEHARQYDVHRRLHDLYEVAQNVVRLVPKGGWLFQAIPVEFDANAAAARFVRSHFGEQRIDALVDAKDDDVALFRTPVASSPIDCLPERMVAFLATCPELSERWADGRRDTFRRRLDLHWGGAGSRWARFVADAELRLPR